MSAHKVEAGFTLIEIIVTIAILSIAMTFAVPSFRTFQQNSELSSLTSELVTVLNQARSEAVMRRSAMTLTPTSATNWAAGWVLTDAGGAQVLVSNRQAGNLTGTIAPVGTASIVFGRDGTIQAYPAGLSLTVCDNRTGENGRRLTISRLGQVTNSQFGCS